MRKPQAGFTIVELLIVIVVIAILAAITVVAYNGVQVRAKNSQTQQALSTWVKALKLYKADNGTYPAYYGCLGTGYPYGYTGTDVSGGQCRLASSPGVENTAFNNAMRPYISTLPAPALVVAGTSTSWYRGLTYVYAGGGLGTDIYIQAAYAGNTTCPSAGGLQPAGEQQNMGGSGNTYCYYQVGFTTDP